MALRDGGDGILASCLAREIAREEGIICVLTLSPLGNILHRNDSNFEKQLDTIRKVYTIQVENIVKSSEMGVKIAIGSDAGAYAVGQVTGILDEIKHFENIGFKKDIVLKCA